MLAPIKVTHHIVWLLVGLSYCVGVLWTFPIISATLVPRHPKNMPLQLMGYRTEFGRSRSNGVDVAAGGGLSPKLGVLAAPDWVG